MIATSVSMTIISHVVKAVYSIMNNTSSLLDSKGKEELQIAYSYLSDANPTVSIVRMALQHMETAYSLLDKDPIVNAENRIKDCNKLCYFIAKLHKELGDSYESTVLYWANMVDLSQYPPKEFESILKKSNWHSLEARYEWNMEKDNSYDPAEDPVWMAGNQHA